MQSSSTKRRKSSRIDSAIPCCAAAMSLQIALNELSVYKDLFEQSSYHMSKTKVKMMQLKKSLEGSFEILDEVLCSLDCDFKVVDGSRFPATTRSCKNGMNPVSKVTDEIYAEQNLISDNECDSNPVVPKLETDNSISQTANIKGSIDTVDSKDGKKSCKIQRERKLVSKKKSLANCIPKDLELTYIVADSYENVKKRDNLKASTHLQLNVNNSEVDNTTVNSKSKPLFPECSKKTKCLSGSISRHTNRSSGPSPKKIKKTEKIFILNDSSADNKMEEMLIKNSMSEVDSDGTVIEMAVPVTNAEMILSDNSQKNEKSDIVPVKGFNGIGEYNDNLSADEQFIPKSLPPKITPIRHVLNDQRRKIDSKKRKSIKEKISFGEIAENLNKNFPLDDLLPKHLRFSK